MTDHRAARLNMVENQVRTNRVTDERLIEAMETIPRELFVPSELRAVAYVDEDLKVARGRYLMEPMVLARLLQTAEVQPTDIALDIGPATGYSTAVLARLCETVVGVEADAALVDQASETLTELGIDNAVVIEGDLQAGNPAQGPYDVILFSGAISDVPDRIAGQLADGGRLVAVRRSGPGVGQALLVTRFADILSPRVIFDAATPYLPGYEPKLEFVF
jgi:protein-L-isoaspartate(D-aspartate) O-methyltransferase